MFQLLNSRAQAILLKFAEAKERAAFATYTITLHFATLINYKAAEIPRNLLKVTSPLMLVVGPNNNNSTHAQKFRITNNPWLHNINPTQTISAPVTNINVSDFPHNVLPTATLNVSYSHARTITRAFFDTGSQRSFVSPELVRKLNLPVTEQVPVHLSTFGNDSALHFLGLVKVKVQVGRRRIPIKLPVHDSASMGYLNCPGIYNVAQTLEKQGNQLADQTITSDSLTGIELLIVVDYFAQFITRQKRASGISLFVTRGGGVIPFGTIPRWAIHNESSNTYTGSYTCARIICESKPESELTELWDLERIGIIQDDLSPSGRETVSIVRSSMEKSDAGYIVRLPFKDTTRPLGDFLEFLL